MTLFVLLADGEENHEALPRQVCRKARLWADISIWIHVEQKGRKNIELALNSSIQAIGGGEEGEGVTKLAITGRTWALVRQHFPELVPRVLLRTVVWARMSPDQKAQLVEALQVIGVNWSEATFC